MQTPAFTSWGKGTLDPAIKGRTDLQQYYSSAEKLDNLIVRPYGVPVRRPGTKFAHAVKDSDRVCRIIEFVFNVTESYAIEMGAASAVGVKDGWFRFYKDKSLIKLDLADGGTWLATQGYKNGDYLNVGGKLYYCHKDYETWKEGIEYAKYDLVEQHDQVFECRFSHLSSSSNDPTASTTTDEWFFDTTPVDYTTALNHPVTGANKDEFWIELEEEGTGTFILEVSHDFIDSEILDISYAQKNDVIDMVQKDHYPKQLIRFAEDTWSFADTRLSYDRTITSGPWNSWNQSPIQLYLDSTTAGAVTNLHSYGGGIFTQQDVDDAVKFKLGKAYAGAGGVQEQGQVEARTFIDSTNIEVNIINLQTVTQLIPTLDWAREAFDSTTGPTSVSYHEARKVYASSVIEPQSEWFSNSFYYNNFGEKPVSEADGGFILQLNTEQANDIKWISSGESLLSGTYGGEFSTVSPSDGALTRESKNAKRQSGWGSELVRPRKIGSFVYYVGRGGRKLRELYYNWDNNTFKSNDTTEMSSQITSPGVIEIAYQQNPDSLLWCLKSNGDMCVLSRVPDSEILAWTPIYTAAFGTILGNFKSIAFVPNPDGLTDRGWTIVDRGTTDTPLQYTEYFDNNIVEESTRREELYFMDCGTVIDRYTLTAAATISLSVAAGNVTATAFSGSAMFSSDDVGHNLRLVDADKTTIGTMVITGFTSDTVVTGTTTDLVTVSDHPGGQWAVSNDVIPVQSQFTVTRTDGIAIVDGISHEDITLDAEYDTQTEYYEASIGIAFDSLLKTNPLNSQTPTGQTKNKIRRIHAVGFEVYRTAGLYIGSDEDNLKPLALPEGVTATDLYSGTIPNITFEGAHDYTGYIIAKQSTAYPMNLLGIYPKVTYNEGR